MRYVIVNDPEPLPSPTPDPGRTRPRRRKLLKKGDLVFHPTHRNAGPYKIVAMFGEGGGARTVLKSHPNGGGGRIVGIPVRELIPYRER